MDLAENVESETGLDGAGVAVGEKRPIANSEALAGKRRRCWTPDSMKRVAEIVIVLSAMAKMRGGGRDPTDAELGLMAEARERLVEVCEGLAPKDIVGRDAIGTIIEDLGLNAKQKEMKLGFRMPRLTISERLSIAKKKIEESKRFHASAAQPLQTGTAETSTPVPHHLSTSEVRASTATSGLPSSQFGRDSSSIGFARPQAKLDGVSNMPSHVSQGSATHSLVNAPTWSIQSQPGALTKPGQENKVFNHDSTKFDGPDVNMSSRMTLHAARDQTYKPFVTQSSSGALRTNSISYVQAPINTHNEILKIIQQILQPKLPERPTWTPPSREYMNKALTCQTCKLTINEIESVLICDACEKGFHLKCLQPNTQKVIPRGEWHCARCLSLCNGKPLPPKYGRVMRSISTSKAPSSMAIGQSNTSGSQPSSENKVGNPVAKVNLPKVLENGNSGLQAPAVPGTAANTSVQPASDPKIPNGKNLSSSEKQIDQEASSGTCPDSGPSEHPQITESSINEERRDLESNSQPTDTDTVPNANKVGSDDPNPSNCVQNVEIGQQNSEVPLNEKNEVSIAVEDAEEAPTELVDGDCSAEIKCEVPARRSHSSSEVTDHPKVSSDDLRVFEWVGNAVQVEDGKQFYQSCCIGGVTYKLQDHALFHLSSDKLLPSKLQAMWEDVKSGSKFVDIRRCYFPSDLPETIGRPYTPESSEVYESNNNITVLASLIRGPCVVLPITKFEEESEKRNQLGPEDSKGLRPIFLCKWLYDEWKGSFQPVSG